MGKISEYQRQGAVSSAVGTPGLDQSGEMVAKAVGATADQLIVRQKALDNVEVANAYYSFQAEDEVQRLKMQQEFKSAPEAFGPEYERRSADLARNFLQSLPERSRSSFEQLLTRRNASIQPANTKWLIDAQNIKALDLSEQTGAQFTVAASTWADANSYLENIEKYRETFSSFAPALLNPDKVEAIHISNATRMYVASRLDNNSGNPILLRKELEENEPFKQAVVSALGAQGYNAALSAAKKQVESLMNEQTYDMLKDSSFGDEEMGKVEALFNTPAGLAVSQATRDVMLTENALEAIARGEDSELYAGQTAVLQKRLAEQKLYLEIATKRDDSQIKRDDVEYSRLEQVVIAESMGIPTGEKFTAEAKRISERADNNEVLDQMGSLSNAFLKSAFIPLKAARQFVTGKQSFEFGAKAPKTHSEHLVGLYRAKAEILSSRNAGKINNKDAYNLITKLAKPLAAYGQYDKISKGQGDYAIAYNEFDEVARNTVLRGGEGLSPAQRRVARDAVRSRMFEAFMESMADFENAAFQLSAQGLELQKAGVRGLINKIKADFFLASNAGLKVGDPIIYSNGVASTFKGYTASGEKVADSPKGLELSQGNL